MRLRAVALALRAPLRPSEVARHFVLKAQLPLLEGNLSKLGLRKSFIGASRAAETALTLERCHFDRQSPLLVSGREADGVVARAEDFGVSDHPVCGLRWASPKFS